MTNTSHALITTSMCVTGKTAVGTCFLLKPNINWLIIFECTLEKNLSLARFLDVANYSQDRKTLKSIKELTQERELVIDL